MFVFMVYNMQVPVLPLSGEKIGLNSTEIGIFVGSLMFAGLIARYFANNLAMLFQKRNLLLMGIFLYLPAAIFFPFTSSFFFLVILRATNGLGHGLATTFFATAAADELPDKHLGTGMGYFGVGQMLSASIAPIIALGIVRHISYNAFFVACTLFIVLAIILLLLTKKRTTVKIPEKEKYLQKRHFVPGFWKQNVLVFFLGIIMSGIMAFTAIYVNQQNLTAIAWFFVIAAIAGIAIRPATGRLFDIKGPFQVLLPATFSLIISILLIIYSKTNLTLIIAGVFYGAADGAVFPTLQAWVLKEAGTEKREAAVGMFFNFYDLGMGLGSTILGKVINLSSYRAMFYFLTLIATMYFFSCLFFSKTKA